MGSVLAYLSQIQFSAHQLPTLILSCMTVQEDLNARSSAWQHCPLPDWVCPVRLLTAPTPVMITLLEV